MEKRVSIRFRRRSHRVNSNAATAGDLPGETFRVLKEKEIRQLGEYRTRRLVLEAWDAQQR
jgi:hypothetical protein